MDTFSRSTLNSRRSTPQGVVLLVILGMLAVLALLGIAFTTFSATEENSSENMRISKQVPRPELSPDIVILEALSQLIADTNNPQSAIRGHSLLRRMYGNDNDVNATTGLPPGNGVIDSFEFFNNPFNGPGDLGDTSVVSATPALPIAPIDFNFIYNYRVISPGPDSMYGTSDDVVDKSPRPPEYVWNSSLSTWVRGGGFDVDYTYPDHQNMYLAAVRADGTVLVPSFHRPGYLVAAGGGDWTSTSNLPGQGRRIILRPRQADHTTNFPYVGAPAAPTTTGVYDVDNMGLGRTDSVWVDIGFPVQRTLSGRKFKPLVAFLVIDLDGKLNLNAHGNLTCDKLDDSTGAFLFPNFPSGTWYGTGEVDSHSDMAPVAMLTEPAAVPPLPTQAAVEGDLPLGSGSSPTEVNLQNLFSRLFFPTLYPAQGDPPPGTGTNPSPRYDPREYAWLLEGRPSGTGSGTLTPAFSTSLSGRWGEADLWDRSTPIPPRAGSTYVSGGLAGNSSDDEVPYVEAPVRGDFAEGKAAGSTGRYRTPPDLDGTGGLAVSTLGQPRYLPQPNQVGSPPGNPGPLQLGWGGASGWAGLLGTGAFGAYQRLPENIDEADEIDLVHSRGTDAPFGPRDLELLYRYNDIDSSSLLTSRLVRLAPSLFDLAIDPVSAFRRRMMLTTESRDLVHYNKIPLLAASSTAPPGQPANAGNGTFPFFFTNPTFRQTLPESILSGKRLRLNPHFDSTNFPYVDRQQSARSLYLIMYANAPQPVSDAMAKRLAQFAINVVEYCDTVDTTPPPPATRRGDTEDEIMTPFVYDKYPGTGWDTNNLGPTMDTANLERGVVWGTEALRLVINEVLAYEDPAGTVNLWIELFNPSPYPVDLNWTNQTYEIVVTDASLVPTADGEPPPASVGPVNTLKFNSPTPSGPVPAGGYLVIGPGGTAATLPAVLGGGPYGSPVRYSPTTPFTGGIVAPSTGASPPFRVFLRRLANPTIPEAGTASFPDSGNPYITVDALAARRPLSGPMDQLTCYSDTTFSMTPGNVLSKERRSLGVNYTTYGLAPPAMTGGQTHTLGIDNSVKARDLDGDGTAEPWPMFVFPDRPLVSPMELLFVPAVSPQHLTTAFASPHPKVTANPYTPAAAHIEATSLTTGVPPDIVNVPPPPLPPPTYDPAVPMPFREVTGDEYLIGHMLNLFREVPGSLVPTPGFYRVLEYVEVPSRMNGTQDPNIFVSPPDDPIGRRRQERVPGKININTMWEQEIFQALFNNHPAVLDPNAFTAPPGPAASPAWVVGTALTSAGGFPSPYAAPASPSEMWRRLLMSIANPAVAISSLPVGDGTLFTSDDRPFRSFAHGTTGAPIGNAPTSIQSTVLRAFADGAIAAPTPLFSDSRTVPPPGLSGAGAPTNLEDYPYFNYQLLQKMSNVVTTRSNVFAVWMTVGFFEVGDEDPNRLSSVGVSNAPPQLGTEINADIGQNVRHRAFFIIDRSQARGYTGPPRSSAELQDILGQVVIHSRIIE